MVAKIRSSVRESVQAAEGWGWGVGSEGASHNFARLLDLAGGRGDGRGGAVELQQQPDQRGLREG